MKKTPVYGYGPMVSNVARSRPLQMQKYGTDFVICETKLVKPNIKPFNSGIERDVQEEFLTREFLSKRYDDERSIALKIDLLKSLNLAGAMLWSIEMDNFRGICGKKYPLLSTINLKLGKDINELPSNAIPASAVSPSVGDCPSKGLCAYPKDCSRFYQCLKGVRFDFVCRSGLWLCNWPQTVKCNII
uniref:GH18 domain-containing protein n=1 Tax=Glossina palpalis gambiensis TaxID=67801 RepID=A0A1B0BHM2_9MUSC